MFKLPNKKVLVKPVVWEGWLHKGHSGVWLNDGAVMMISVPVSRSTGELKSPLTKEEIDFFENSSLSGMDFSQGDLNPRRKPDYRNHTIPYWYTKEVTIRKPATIVTSQTVLKELDLSIPEDYLEYKILCSNSGLGGIVALGWDSRYNQATHKIVLVDEGYDSETKASTAQDNIDAYAALAKMSGSQQKLYEFLSVYWLEHPNSAKPSPDAKVQFMLAQVQEIITKNAKEFLEIIKNDYDSKLLIHEGIRLSIIKLIGNTFVLMPDEIPVGNSLKEVILYFKDERHQEDRLKLVAQIEAGDK